MIPEILKNFTLSVDGRGKAGIATEITLPKITLKTDEHQGGGMDAPVDLVMGMEKLTASGVLAQFDRDTLKLIGLVSGAVVPITVRGAMQGEAGVIIPVLASMRGIFTEMDPGSWKAAEKSELKFSFSLRYYRLEINGETIYEIDVGNMIRIINGVDQLAAERLALGLGGVG